MIEQMHLRFHRLLLLRIQGRRFQFPKLKLIQFHLICQIPLPLLQYPKFLFQRNHLLILLTVHFQQRANIIKPIQNQRMILLLQKKLMIVLPVQIHQMISHLLQNRNRDWRVINKRTTASIPNLPSQNQLLPVLNLQRFQQLPDHRVLPCRNRGLSNRLP